MTEVVVAVCIAVIALSGLLTMLPLGKPSQIRGLGAGLHVLASVAGLAVVLMSVSGQSALLMPVDWPLGFQRLIRIDYISALFLIPAFFLTAVAAVYGSQYTRHPPYESSWRKIQFLFAMLSAALLLVISARHVYLFLGAWEVMALSAFLLVGCEGAKAEVRAAAWTYLLAAHACTLALMAFFCFLHLMSGGLLLDRVAPELFSAGGRNLLFGLALVGFGLKAGVYPLHFWLPPAHAAAPSHVSALMSGVMLKIGVYGVVRTIWILSPLPAEWGFVLAGLGALSAVLGVVYALAQHDLKRLLAYHSVENIGIIFLALGLGTFGISQKDSLLSMLGFSAAILHVWNHSLFKGLLFLTAGAVVHASGTRTIDSLGGLVRRMPQTAVLFLIGAAAISGLPPLNGFVSEFLLYFGLGRAALTLSPGLAVAAALAFAALALAGALALACFAKVFGVAFLGEARTPGAVGASEAGPVMRAAMLMLALVCFGIGLFGDYVLQFFFSVLSHWLHAVEPENTRPLQSAFSMLRTLTLVFVLTVGGLYLLLRSKIRSARRVPTWDCGYIAPSVRMQYTASSFAEFLGGIYSAVLGPVLRFKSIVAYFPHESTLHSSSQDIVTRLVLDPLSRSVQWSAHLLRPLQRSLVQAHILYIVITLVVLLLINGQP